MGCLFGRSFRTSKFKALLNLALSRLSVLKNQHTSRCSLARTDVVQLLNLGHQDGALIRIERVMNEQNMLDVLVMIEGYCIMLIERITLIKQQKDCPDELKEAISSLVFAATRCGDFPELQEIRAVFTSHFGKEFSARSAQLRNNCGVNAKMIQKLSTRQPSMESRLKVLKEIASANNIAIPIEELSSEEDNFETPQKTPNHHPKPESSGSSGHDTKDDGDIHHYSPDKREVDKFSDSMVAGTKYRDVAHAAQAAFESAAYAAVAARAAVELSRAESHSHSPKRDVSDVPEFMKIGSGFENIHHIHDYGTKEDGDNIHDSNSGDNVLKGTDISTDITGTATKLEQVHIETVSEEHDHEAAIECSQISRSMTDDVDLEMHK